MSRALRSYPESQRPAIVKRRLAQKTKGNGYWGARDYIEKLKVKTSTNKGNMENQSGKQQEN